MAKRKRLDDLTHNPVRARNAARRVSPPKKVAIETYVNREVDGTYYANACVRGAAPFGKKMLKRCGSPAAGSSPTAATAGALAQLAKAMGRK